MTRCVLGLPGSGKIAYLLKQMKKAAEDGQDCIFVVPDQASFETERMIYRKLGPKTAARVKVTFFNRLAREILDRYGASKPYADDVTKEILMHKAVQTAAPFLTFYRNMAKKSSFPSYVLNEVARFQNGGYRAEELEQFQSENLSSLLKAKITDLSLLFSTYESLLEKDFSDKLNDLKNAAILAEQKAYFQGKQIFFAFFDSFSGSQYLMLKPMVQQADCVFTFVTDQIRSTKPMFLGINRVISALSRLSREPLSYELLSPKKPPAQRITKLFQTPHLYGEADFVAAYIRKLVIKEGYRYRDIAVLAPTDAYAQPLESAFRKYDIPCFLDFPESVAQKPLVRFLVSCIEALDFETSSLLRFMKSGFVRIQDENGETKLLDLFLQNELERFAFEWNLHKKDWLNPFPETKQTKRIEPVRNELIEKLTQLKEKISPKGEQPVTGDVITEALSDFVINTMQIEKTITGLCRQSAGDGTEGLVLNKARSDEYRQLWDIIITLLESLHAGLKDYPISLPEYQTLLLHLLSKTMIAKPPQLMDAVLCGNLSRTRVSDVKAVFICGAAEGVLPAVIPQNGLLTHTELEQMEALGLSLGETRELSWAGALLSLYKARELPKEYLIISYPALGTDNAVQMPARFLSEYNLEIDDASTLGEAFYSSSPAAARQRLARVYRNTGSPVRATLLKALQSDTLFLKRLDNTVALQTKTAATHRINPDYAKKLLFHAEYSPTVIETMNKCKFQFFCRYGLNIQQPRNKRIDSLNIGNIIHHCLQDVLRLYADKQDAFQTFLSSKPEEIQPHIHTALNQYRETELLGDVGKTRRFSVLYHRLSETVLRMLLHIRFEMQHSRFRPTAFETVVQKPLGEFVLKGKTDRIDVLEDENGTCIRIIDYKTGSKKMQLSELYYGVNLQLLLYLFAVCDGENYIPSGVLYVPAFGNLYVTDPFSNGERNQLNTELTALKPSGIVVESTKGAEDLLQLDQTYQQLTNQSARGGKPKYLDISFISKEAYENLKKYTGEFLNQQLETVCKGVLDAVPLDLKPKPCEYCEFEMVCGILFSKETTAINPDRIQTVLYPEPEKAD